LPPVIASGLPTNGTNLAFPTGSWLPRTKTGRLFNFYFPFRVFKRRTTTAANAAPNTKPLGDSQCSIGGASRFAIKSSALIMEPTANQTINQVGIEPSAILRIN
jgi:hypothetical protein